MNRLLTSVSPTKSGYDSVVTAPSRQSGPDTTTFYYEVFEGRIAAVVVIFELPENKGLSVTHAAEKLFNVLQHKHAKDKPMFLFESYFLDYGDTNLAAVVVKNNRALWQPITVNQVTKLIAGIA